MRTKMLLLIMIAFIIAFSVVENVAADTAFSDDFEDGNRDGWYKQNDSTNYVLTVANDTAGIGTGNALFLENITTATRRLVANTSTVLLEDPNDYILLTFDFRLTGTTTQSNDGLRFGFHDAAGTVVTADDSGDGTTDNDPGYFIRMGTGTDNTMRVEQDEAVNALLGGDSLHLFAGTYTPTINDFLTHHFEFEIKPLSSSPPTLDGIQWKLLIDSVQVAFGNSYSEVPQALFNQIAFSSYTGGIDFAIDNVILTSSNVLTNSPPVPDAGGYAVVETGVAYDLTGSYLDDGNPLGGPVTFAWSVVDVADEPNVLFNTTTILTPTVTFDSPGMYELQLEVNDGELSGTDIFYAHVKGASKFDTLQAHWKFDDASDADDYYYKMTYFEGTPEFNSVDAISGKSISLDPADRMYFGPAIGAETSMSVALWMKPASGVLKQTARGLISKYPDDSTAPAGGWTVQWRDINTLQFRVGRTYGGGGGDLSMSEPNSFSGEEWVHVVAIFDGETGTSTLYRNGELRGTDSTTAVSFDPLSSLQIGQANWSGLIDEVYLYDYPISVEEIRALYTVAGNAPPMVTPDDIVVKGAVNTAIPLSVTIVDEDPTVSVVWEVVDKPAGSIVTLGSVTIGTGTASTTGTFNTIGDYTLKATATDSGALVGTSDDFVVKVRSVGFDGLEAQFDFNSGLSNSAGDVTYTGTAVGGAVQTTGAGISGSGGLVLNGTTSHLDFNKYLGAEEEITVMLWYKTDVTDTAQRLVQKYANDQTTRGWALRLRSAAPYNTSGLLGSAFNYYTELRSPDAIGFPASTWTHVAMTFDGSTAKLYHNGVFVDDDKEVVDYSPADIVTPFVMGYRSDGSAIEFFDGVIDEVRVYDYALNHAQIYSIFTGDGGVAPATCISAVLEADFDDNCYVDINDLKYMAAVWLTADATADIAPPVVDGTVNLVDFSLLGQQWMDCVDPTDSNCL